MTKGEAIGRFVHGTILQDPTNAFKAISGTFCRTDNLASFEVMLTDNDEIPHELRGKRIRITVEARDV